uniref:DOT1 domain-containing protein n=1 Tax=Globisporangium ultimum (strain ATCC 200006 / CBS 805.95 / DAOM BR144) TaxID=431595 RepID=K3WMC4_GLOUD
MGCADVDAITRFQAIFRGKRCREMHVDRVRKGLPWSPFVPAKMEAVERMLQLAALRPGETLLDIGSGDGRVVMCAATLCPSLKQAIGVEIDATLVALSRRRITDKQLESRAVVVHDDWMNLRMNDVDVATLFFLPHRDIAAILKRKLRPGTRVITYVFQIKEWEPQRMESTVPFMTDHGESLIYLYRVPA